MFAPVPLASLPPGPDDCFLIITSIYPAGIHPLANYTAVTVQLAAGPHPFQVGLSPNCEPGRHLWSPGI
jgi:hypothetical protein